MRGKKRWYGTQVNRLIFGPFCRIAVHTWDEQSAAALIKIDENVLAIAEEKAFLRPLEMIQADSFEVKTTLDIFSNMDYLDVPMIILIDDSKLPQTHFPLGQRRFNGRN